MKYADLIALSILHLILLVLFFQSILAQIRTNYRKDRERNRMTTDNPSADLSIHRGEQSMNAIYVFYGASTVIFSLAIECSDCLVGFKSALILIDFSILSYLFYFNSWFRNSFLFPVIEKMKKV